MSDSHNFPPLGLTYFWCLNDYCDDSAIDRQIEEFSRAQIGTVCLHPRDGLLLPYGSSDWFDFIRLTALKLAAKGIGIWLYDEDPFPSGNAGGRIILDHPELIAHKIEMYRATQIAPVAILWPIKSFHLLNKFWQAEPGGLRGELTELVLACLEAHVGIQMLDEVDFQNAKMKNGMLKIGNASYSHVIVPGSTVWSKTTWDLLEKYAGSTMCDCDVRNPTKTKLPLEFTALACSSGSFKEGLKVYQYGARPRYLESNAKLHVKSTAAAPVIRRGASAGGYNKSTSVAAFLSQRFQPGI